MRRHHVVAEVGELVLDAFVQNIERVDDEVGLHPHGRLAFSVEARPRVVVAEVVEVKKGLVGVKARLRENCIAEFVLRARRGRDSLLVDV